MVKNRHLVVWTAEPLYLYILPNLPIKIQKNNNYILINLGKLINQQVTKSATKNRRIEYKQTQTNAPMKKSQEGGGGGGD